MVDKEVEDNKVRQVKQQQWDLEGHMIGQVTKNVRKRNNKS